jgi:hypothetical protein
MAVEGERSTKDDAELTLPGHGDTPIGREMAMPNSRTKDKASGVLVSILDLL